MIGELRKPKSFRSENHLKLGKWERFLNRRTYWKRLPISITTPHSCLLTILEGGMQYPLSLPFHPSEFRTMLFSPFPSQNAVHVPHSLTFPCVASMSPFTESHDHALL
ncbi:hypothetical protein KP509_24G017100 [Ceratopteris richardii]|uniref:Uncharacterized protein n=1 Tax=Ceratopteris richardii TaxID=49495 RepID=A0A8T2RVL7_CERRI|nr:hypothetical protein KP509_24G017100 [Ceratopteris richardii]